MFRGPGEHLTPPRFPRPNLREPSEQQQERKARNELRPRSGQVTVGRMSPVGFISRQLLAMGPDPAEEARVQAQIVRELADSMRERRA